uniref:Uncharacterized protein n=1 Tax=Spongospora subterranea TaxID=70186 RepID=A0A0H5RPQ7_9EUKA|eukprot:CRZ10709.1 hypothetical protein [Spongospora subterranea]
MGCFASYLNLLLLLFSLAHGVKFDETLLASDQDAEISSIIEQLTALSMAKEPESHVNLSSNESIEQENVFRKTLNEVTNQGLAALERRFPPNDFKHGNPSSSYNQHVNTYSDSDPEVLLCDVCHKLFQDLGMRPVRSCDQSHFNHIRFILDHDQPDPPTDCFSWLFLFFKPREGPIVSCFR